MDDALPRSVAVAATLEPRHTLAILRATRPARRIMALRAAAIVAGIWFVIDGVQQHTARVAGRGWPRTLIIMLVLAGVAAAWVGLQPRMVSPEALHRATWRKDPTVRWTFTASDATMFATARRTSLRWTSVQSVTEQDGVLRIARGRQVVAVPLELLTAEQLAAVHAMAASAGVQLTC